jgi:hypothetical protein
MSEPSMLARILAGLKPGGGATFGGNTFGGNTFGGNTFGGATFGASAQQPPVQPPVTVQASLPQLPDYEAPGSFSNKYMPPMQAPRPQAATMPPMQAPQPAPMPQQSVMGMGFDPTPPVSMEMQGMKAPMPQGRNELERDYHSQLAQNPNGFGKPDWLARWLG